MRQENSGKIFRFPLDFEMGYRYCELLDFSDLSDFSGRLLNIFRFEKIDAVEDLNILEIKNSEIMFGPIPLSNYPNIKGKGAWKFVGQLIMDRNAPIPVLKSVQGNYTSKDWTVLDKWYKLYDFENRSDFCDYEEIRNLELPVLYRMEDVQRRATMQLLIEKNEDVGRYYDLKDFTLRQTYIITLNTSIPPRKAKELLDRLL